MHIDLIGSDRRFFFIFNLLKSKLTLRSNVLAGLYLESAKPKANRGFIWPFNDSELCELEPSKASNASISK